MKEELEKYIEELEGHLKTYTQLAQNRATRIGNINYGKGETTSRTIYRLKEILKSEDNITT